MAEQQEQEQAQPQTIVLITGANQGLGYEITKMLCLQHPQHHVLMGSRDIVRGARAAATLKDQSCSVEAIQLDVLDEDSVRRARDEIEARLGRLDVLINNAAIVLDSPATPPADPLSYTATMNATFATNVTGPAFVTETFIPLLSRSTPTIASQSSRGGGMGSRAAGPRLVFMSSRAGSLRSNAAALGQPLSYTREKYMAPAYYASKAALNLLVVLYANRFAEKGWKVNACCPGFRPTNLSGFDANAGTLEDGAVNAVRLATLGADGETGTFSNIDGPIEW